MLCQRCARTICPECQTQAAVGYHCPECMKASRQSAPKTKPRIVVALKPGSSTPVITYSIIALCLVLYIGQRLNSQITVDLLYVPWFTEAQPWRMVTSLFVHSPGSFLHILLNMFSLYIIGPPLEAALGRWRFLTLYLLSGLGGSVAVLLLAPGAAVLGASGAIFGLLGAFLIIQRTVGVRSNFIIGVVAINLVLGFIIPNVSWQAHVGGLVVGALTAYIILKTRSPKKRNQQILLLFGVLAGLVVLTIVGIELMSLRFR